MEEIEAAQCSAEDKWQIICLALVLKQHVVVLVDKSEVCIQDKMI